MASCEWDVKCGTSVGTSRPSPLCIVPVNIFREPSLADNIQMAELLNPLDRGAPRLEFLCTAVRIGPLLVSKLWDALC